MKIDKKDFPILVNNEDLLYLDNACTTLKPNQVIEAELEYYKKFGACAGRSSHRLGRETNKKLDEARGKVAKFVDAHTEEIIWTRNATEGLNLIVNGFDYTKRKVVTSVMEHHSVLLPLMRLNEQRKIHLEIAPCNKDGEIDFSNVIDRETGLVVINNWNNFTGTGRDIKEIAKITHDHGASICVDGAQGVPHHKTDFKKDHIDFLCFSAHKMLGPTGIGAIACKKEHMNNLEPLNVGGGSVKTVTVKNVESLENYERFEAGIQNYSGIFGFAAACDYLYKLGMENVEKHEQNLAKELYDQLTKVGATIYGSGKKQGALYSFNLKNAKPHELAMVLDNEKIAVRSGFFCAQPATEAVDANDGAVRASAYVYNTVDDIKKFGDILNKVSVLYS
ncbi:MAG: cysteine desulfurase [Candidatus Micrarchaeota archaeon]